MKIETVASAILYSLILLLSIFDLLNPSSKIGTTILIFCIISVFFGAKKNIYLYAFAFFPIFYFMGMLVSGASIYYGAYMRESQIIGYPNGTIGMFALLYLVFIASFTIGFSYRFDFYNVKITKILSYLLQSYAASVISIIVVFVSFLIVAIYSSPILLGINRVSYFDSVPDYIRYISPVLYTLIFFPCYQLFVLNKKKTGSFFILLYLFFIWFLLGQKFSGFIAALTVLLAVSVSFDKVVKLTFKNFSMLMFSVFSMISLILYQYGGGYSSLELLFERIALQAQVGWVFMSQPFYWLFGEYRDVTFNQMTRLIDYLYLPREYYLIFSKQGFVLTGYYPAAFVLKYGWLPSIIISFLVFVLLGSLAKFCFVQLKNKSPFVSFFLLSAFLQVNSFIFTASPPGLIGAFFILSAILLYMTFSISKVFSKLP